MRGRVSVRIVDGLTSPAPARLWNAETVAQFEQACRAPRERMARIAITPRWVR
jgi:hypothetical protein